MEVGPEGFVETNYQGIVNIKGPAGALPVILLRDERGRTMAIPLGSLESDLIRSTLDGNSEGPQPYRTLIATLEKLNVTFSEVRVLYSSEFDLPTLLMLRPAAGPGIEVALPCGDGITFAQLARVPIYVAEELISAVGACAGETPMGTPNEQ